MVVLCSTVVCGALEIVNPVFYPQSTVVLGYSLNLDDDVYSGDVVGSVEWAVTPRWSLLLASSYRTVSYLYEISDFEQVHEYMDLETEGFNRSYVGFKYAFSKYAGFESVFRSRAFGGDTKELYNGLKSSLLLFIPFSQRVFVGGSLEWTKFFERHNFEPGRELGGKLSLVWQPGRWRIEDVILFRTRYEDSRNLNLNEYYQKQKDQYNGVKVRFAVERKFISDQNPLSLGLGYQLNRGHLFGRETGHLMDLYLKKNF